MELKSKYNIGDYVYKIWDGKKSYKEKCPVCDKNGFIYVKDKKYLCPERCHYGYVTKWEPEKWSIQNNGIPMTVGRIEILYYGENHEANEIRYMCRETGIGSGDIHPENSLWSTEKEAQAECDKRNKEKNISKGELKVFGRQPEQTK